MNFLKKRALLLFWIILLTDVVLDLLKLDNWRWFTKPLLIPLLMIFLIINKSKPGNPFLSKLIFSGLLAAWIGDILLMFSSTGCFIAGMAAFVTMQLLYAYIYYSIQKPGFKINKKGIAGVLFMLLFSFFLFKSLETSSLFTGYAIPVAIYIAAISLMVSLAANLSGAKRTPNTGSLFIFYGAVFFVVSDGSIAVQKFLFPGIAGLSILVMLTYGIAQYLIVKGFYKFQMIKLALVLLFSIICMYPAISQNYPTADGDATLRTKKLYSNLFRVMQKGVMFGHQDDLSYGTGWMLEQGRSDVHTVTNDYPALIGFDLGHIEKSSPYNLDSVPFNKMAELIRIGYERGNVITLSWHCNNPYNGKTAWDVSSGSVASVLPGGSKNELFKQWLHNVAVFIRNLKSSNGEPIPVLFRPYHELTGGWFWWGKASCSAEEFKALWRFTVDQLKNVEQVHNILYVYNVADFNDQKELEERYPGNDLVDVVSFDAYQSADIMDARKSFIRNNKMRLAILTDFASHNNKLPAFSETGSENLPDKEWFTKTLHEVIKDYRVSYVLVWRNGGLKTPGKGGRQFQPNHSFFTPPSDHPAANDFRQFHSLPDMIFQNKIAGEGIYY
jgi:uncharacterized membrane protein YhhN